MPDKSQRTRIFTAAPPAQRVEITPRVERKRVSRARLTFSERLLRNTAIASAVLLGVLAMRNIPQPWSQTALRGIESALTMRVDLDGSLGKLSFVRSIMPESSLVFLNMTADKIAAPVAGEVAHECISGQMWTMYSCAPGADVRACMAGGVSAVSQLPAGDWYVLIDHGEGVETLYAYLEKPEIEAGKRVARGDKIGVAMGDSLYFEMRENGESVNPWGEN